MKCPICENTFGEFKILEANCQLPIWSCNKKLVRHICPKCDVIFGTQEMLNISSSSLEEMYSRLYRSGWEEIDPTNIDLDLISSFSNKETRTCLNWGAGAKSKVVERAKLFGVDVVNYEPYNNLATNVQTNLSDLQKFDMIISNNVIEHLQNPILDFLNMKKHINNNGYMVHKTACYKYQYEWTEFHLFFFLGRSPYVLAEKTGLKAEQLNEDTFKFTIL